MTKFFELSYLLCQRLYAPNISSLLFSRQCYPELRSPPHCRKPQIVPCNFRRCFFLFSVLTRLARFFFTWFEKQIKNESRVATNESNYSISRNQTVTFPPTIKSLLVKFFWQLRHILIALKKHELGHSNTIGILNRICLLNTWNQLRISAFKCWT